MKTEKIAPHVLRKRLGQNQTTFWSKIGVTQSGGSRYENGRRMPKPVRILLNLVHVVGIDTRHICRSDVDIVEHLKLTDPDMYAKLKRASSRRVGTAAAK